MSPALLHRGLGALDRAIRVWTPFTRKGKTRLMRRKEWAIGIYEGDSPLTLKPARDGRNPVITRHDVTDVRATGVADPFMVPWDGRWYMFFEIINARSGRGEIALATSHDMRTWSYEGRILVEPYHTSFPFVFQCEGSWFMIPEMADANELRLYEAEEFPYVWRFTSTIRKGVYRDSVVFWQEDRLWLLSTKDPHGEQMILLTAKHPMDSWTEHPDSPVCFGSETGGRSAGPIVRWEARLLRLAQDCEHHYGQRVKAFEIDTMDAQTYREHPIAGGVVVAPSGHGWNAFKSHHVDLHEVGPNKWAACVDGAGLASWGNPYPSRQDGS